jgi:hypothetical protein
MIVQPLERMNQGIIENCLQKGTLLEGVRFGSFLSAPVALSVFFCVLAVSVVSRHIRRQHKHSLIYDRFLKDWT